MNKDIEEYLNQKKKMYQERIASAERQERRLRRRLEGQPDRADIIKSINETVIVMDGLRELVDFIEELKSYFRKEANNETKKNNILHRPKAGDPLRRKRRVEDGNKIQKSTDHRFVRQLCSL